MERSTLSNTMAASQFVFVKPEDGSDVSEEMNGAFQLCKDVDAAVWMLPEEVQKLSKSSSEQMFIVQVFAGDAFQKLVSLHMRIYGPSCVMFCYDSGETLPTPVSTHPIFNLAMFGITVCCTSIVKKLRNQIHNQVELMGGQVNRELTAATTHLVASEVGSSKYKAACSWGKPVMLPTWVNQVWEDSQERSVRGQDSCYDKFRCPIFKGVNVTVSQLNAAERREVQQLVEKNGGTYSGSLTVDLTTHVVLKEAKGDKFAVAKRKNIRCVNSRWIFDTIEKGFCVDENLYGLGNGVVAEQNKASTPKQNIAARTPLMSADVSCIGDCTVNPLINETIVTPDTIARLTSARTNCQARAAAVNVSCDGDATSIGRLDFGRIDSSTPFLDGCRIFVSGFSPIEMEKVRRLVNTGGATRFSQMNDSVSHVVLGDRLDERFSVPAQDGSGPHVVNAQWLIQSWKEGKPANEAPFLRKSSDTSSSKSSNSQLCTTAHSTHQQVSMQQDNETADSLRDRDADHVSGELVDDVTGNHQEDVADDPQDDVSDGSMTTAEIFQALTFEFFGFDRLDLQSLKNLVVKLGGSVRTRVGDEVDYAVMPINAIDEVASDGAVVVTNFWLQHCVEEECLLDVTSHPLFSPIEADWDAQPLDECVVSISQYAGTERGCISHLAELLGAKCQDCFVRKDNTRLQVTANTHLIARDPEGSKYLGACKWNLPAVTYNWLVACAAAGTVVDVAPYVVGKAIGLPTQKPVLINNFRKPLHATPNGVRGILGSTSSSSNSTFGTPVGNVDTPSSAKTTFERLTNDDALRQIRERIKNGYNTPTLSLQRLKELVKNEPCPMANTSVDSPAPDCDDPTRINIRDAMACLDSPVVHVEQSEEMPLEEYAAQQLRRALIYDIENNRSAIPGRTIEDILGEEAGKKNKCLQGPLHGLVIVVSKTLANIQGELNRRAAALGANVRWKYDKYCTHFVHQGKTSDTSKELRAAKADGKHIVSPEWLRACEEKHAKQSEHMYPCTQKPNMMLEITTEKLKSLTPSMSSQKTSQSASRKLTTTKTATGISRKLTFTESSNTDDKSLESAKKEIGEMLAAKNKLIPTNSHCQRLTSNSDQRHLRSSSSELSDSNKEKSRSVITWDDPNSRLERERVAPHFAKDSQLSPSPSRHEEVEENLLAKSLTSAQPPRMSDCSKAKDDEEEVMPILMFSGALTVKPNGISKLIEELGGKILSSHDPSPSFTHLIVAKPSRSLKYLSSLASGKWILHQSYLEGIDQRRRFVSEEDYEWGNPNASGVSGLLPEQNGLASAAHRWRVELGDLRKSLPRSLRADIGAFQGWKVIVCASQEKTEGFNSLLLAGGAKFAKTQLPFTRSDGATHCFLDPEKSKSVNIDFQSLIAANVHCLLPEYIGAYLTNKEVEPQNYIVPEALRLMERKGQRKRCSDEDSDGQSKKVRSYF